MVTSKTAKEKTLPRKREYAINKIMNNKPISPEKFTPVKKLTKTKQINYIPLSLSNMIDSPVVSSYCRRKIFKYKAIKNKYDMVTPNKLVNKNWY